MKTTSFGIMTTDGNTFFVEAHRMTIDRAGRLLFKNWYSGLICAVNADEWVRVLRGLTLEDLEGRREHDGNIS